ANKELTFTLDPTIFGTIKLLSIICTIIKARTTSTTCVREDVAKVRIAMISIEEKMPTYGNTLNTPVINAKSRLYFTPINESTTKTSSATKLIWINRPIRYFLTTY